MTKEELEEITERDKIKGMSRDEFIEYLEKKMYNYKKEGETLPYSGSFASVNDFEKIEFDSPY